MPSEFLKLGLSNNVADAIADIGWIEPTPIQSESIPVALDGRDILAQAQTGTGKTGAFGSVILERTEAEACWAKALVLVPTRELAIQAADELNKLSKYTGHKIVAVYGGTSMLRQTQALDKGVDIIVATPGRLCDHLKDDEQLLDDISILVIDEADRMLDMGFRRDLDFISAHVPNDRQVMLFSATMPFEVRTLALRQLNEPAEICVSTDEPVLDLIRQCYMDVEKGDKVEMLRYILAKEPMKTIVFCFTKYRVDKVVRKLKMSFKLAGIHGDIPQNRREEILRKFRKGEIQVLVASDVAARGLDIENVSRIINMDMPPESDTYIHRIGRTGRAGKEGLALSFVMKEEKRLLKEIENRTFIDIERIEAPTEEEMAEVIGTIKGLQRPVIAKKNSRPNDVPVEEKEYILAEINVGSDDQQGKASIAQLIRDYTDVPKKSIGNIVIGQKTSTLEIEKKYLQKTISGMSSCKVYGKTVKIWPIGETEHPITESLEPVREVHEKRYKPRTDNGGRTYRPRDTRQDSVRRPYKPKGPGHDRPKYGDRPRYSEKSDRRSSSKYRNNDRRYRE